MKAPKISIVIPLYVIVDRFFKDFKKYDNLEYPNIEILVVSDRQVELPRLKRRVKLILTNKKNTGPAEKRDLALKFASGEICAFVDDDAYPDVLWLKNATRWFRNVDIVAVGGPGLTPPEDSFWQKIGGYIIESYLCSGGIQRRFYVGTETQRVFVDDWPAYNLLVRTNALKRVEGYGSTFYGGEDTILCMKLVKFGFILYDPEVVVYHHRRSFPIAHLKQISGIGLHRGYFFKKYPETSRRPLYLLPTALTTGLFLIPLLPERFWILALGMILLLWLAGTLSVAAHNVGFVSSAIAGVGIILTHMAYGISFVRGLLTRELTR